jgi:hypothetical protein
LAHLPSVRGLTPNNVDIPKAALTQAILDTAADGLRNPRRLAVAARGWQADSASRPLFTDATGCGIVVLPVARCKDADMLRRRGRHLLDLADRLKSQGWKGESALNNGQTHASGRYLRTNTIARRRVFAI